MGKNKERYEAAIYESESLCHTFWVNIPITGDGDGEDDTADTSVGSDAVDTAAASSDVPSENNKNKPRKILVTWNKDNILVSIKSYRLRFFFPSPLCVRRLYFCDFWLKKSRNSPRESSQTKKSSHN